MPNMVKKAKENKAFCITAGVILFLGNILVILSRFTTNASLSDILLIGGLSHLLMALCLFLLTVYNDLFKPGRKLIISFIIFFAAVVAELCTRKQTVASTPLGDTFMILAFMALSGLWNVIFSKWSRKNLALLPSLGFDTSCMAMLVLSINLISEVEYGSSLPFVGIFIAVVAMIVDHFFMLKPMVKDGQQSYGIWKRITMTTFWTVSSLFSLLLLIIFKAVLTS